MLLENAIVAVLGMFNPQSHRVRSIISLVSSMVKYVAFSLTDREQEVLKVLLMSDDNVQDIAEKLLISRAALYRHVTNLNEKTGTKSRIGLIQLYYSWKK